MADINKLAEIQSAIDTLASGEGSLQRLNISSLSDRVPSLSDEVNIAEIAGIQQKLTGVFGKGINLGAIGKIADCAKNIDDLLLEKVKKKIIDELLANKTAGGLAEKIGDISNAIKVGNAIVNRINELKEKSLAELLIEAKNAGVLDRIAIFKKINDSYGQVVDNINDILGKIESFDVCSMINYKTGLNSPLPQPAKINVKTPDPIPDLSNNIVQSDGNRLSKQHYDDVLFRINTTVSDKTGLTEDASTTAMLTDLQILLRGALNEYSESSGDVSNLDEKYSQEIEKRINANTSQWNKIASDEYRKRARASLYIISKDVQALRDYTMLKKSANNIPGSLASIGVTIYGGPDWDFTTFLDIKPSQRPPELISYWEGKGYNIAEQEAKLRNRNIKTGTLNYSDAFSGAYAGKLRAGFSCASTRFPGGSQLQLKNPDGSIFDPAGLNPSGLVTVDDTGNVELTYKKVDLFISREHVEFYKKANLNNVQIFLISLGTKQGSQYKRAQSLYT